MESRARGASGIYVRMRCNNCGGAQPPIIVSMSWQYSSRIDSTPSNRDSKPHNRQEFLRKQHTEHHSGYSLAIKIHQQIRATNGERHGRTTHAAKSEIRFQASRAPGWRCIWAWPPLESFHVAGCTVSPAGTPALDCIRTDTRSRTSYMHLRRQHTQ